MVILVLFNSFNVVKNLKKADPVARQMPPLYTTNTQCAQDEKKEIDNEKHLFTKCEKLADIQNKYDTNGPNKVFNEGL